MRILEYEIVRKEGWKSGTTEETACGIVSLPGFSVEIREISTGALVHMWTGHYPPSWGGHVETSMAEVQRGLFRRLLSWGWLILGPEIEIPDGAFIPPPVAKRLGRILQRRAIREQKEFYPYVFFPGWTFITRSTLRNEVNILATLEAGLE